MDEHNNYIGKLVGQQIYAVWWMRVSLPLWSRVVCDACWSNHYLFEISGRGLFWSNGGPNAPLLRPFLDPRSGWGFA
jgi:hypothetical protein